MITEFFNKSKFVVSKLSDQVVVTSDVPFSLPLYAVDILKYNEAIITNAIITKTSGRDTTILPVVCTINNNIVTATIPSASWNGLDNLQLSLTIGDDIVTISLFNKGI
jgi:hypothetical protein